MGQAWLLTQIDGFCRKELLKMMDWKEWEHEDVDTHALNDPNFLETLRACVLLKFILMPRMRAQAKLLRSLISIWDINQKIFVIGD